MAISVAEGETCKKTVFPMFSLWYVTNFDEIVPDSFLATPKTPLTKI